MKAVLALVILFASSLPNYPSNLWKNGGESKNIDHVIFCTHDWIAWKAYLLAEQNVELGWLKTTQNYMFFGTEVPMSDYPNCLPIFALA